MNTDPITRRFALTLLLIGFVLIASACWTPLPDELNYEKVNAAGGEHYLREILGEPASRKQYVLTTAEMARDPVARALGLDEILEDWGEGRIVDLISWQVEVLNSPKEGLDAVVDHSTGMVLKMNYWHEPTWGRWKNTTGERPKPPRPSPSKATDPGRKHALATAVPRPN